MSSKCNISTTGCQLKQKHTVSYLDLSLYDGYVKVNIHLHISIERELIVYVPLLVNYHLYSIILNK